MDKLFAIVNRPPPPRFYSPELDRKLGFEAFGVRPTGGGCPDQAVIDQFNSQHPDLKLFASGEHDTLHVEGDDERFIPDDVAQRIVLNSGLMCVWLPDFIAGSDADDGSRCADGSIPRRLFFVFPRA